MKHNKLRKFSKNLLKVHLLRKAINVLKIRKKKTKNTGKMDGPHYDKSDINKALFTGLALHYVITLVALNRQNPFSTWKWLAPFGSYARAGDYLEVKKNKSYSENAWDTCCDVEGFPTINNTSSSTNQTRNLVLIATTGDN